MKKLLAPGVLAGLCTTVAAIATVYGKDVLADYFRRPELPGEILIVLSTVGATIAGFLPSHKATAPVAAAPAAPVA